MELAREYEPDNMRRLGKNPLRNCFHHLRHCVEVGHHLGGQKFSIFSISFGPTALVIAFSALLMPSRNISGSWVENLQKCKHAEIIQRRMMSYC